MKPTASSNTNNINYDYLNDQLLSALISTVDLRLDKKNRFNTIENLLAQGANCNLTYQGETPLMIAIRQADLKLAEIILKHRIYLDYRNPQQLNALDLAAISQQQKIHAAITKKLQQLNLNLKDSFQNIAPGEKRNDILLDLLQQGADPNTIVDHNYNLLVAAMIQADAALAKIVIEFPVNLNSGILSTTNVGNQTMSFDALAVAEDCDMNDLCFKIENKILSLSKNLWSVFNRDSHKHLKNNFYYIDTLTRQGARPEFKPKDIESSESSLFTVFQQRYMGQHFLYKVCKNPMIQNAAGQTFMDLFQAECITRLKNCSPSSLPSLRNTDEMLLSLNAITSNFLTNLVTNTPDLDLFIRNNIEKPFTETPETIHFLFSSQNLFNSVLRLHHNPELCDKIFFVLRARKSIPSEDIDHAESYVAAQRSLPKSHSVEPSFVSLAAKVTIDLEAEEQKLPKPIANRTKAPAIGFNNFVLEAKNSLPPTSATKTIATSISSINSVFTKIGLR